MLEPGIAVILSRAAFRVSTIYNNMYARDGNSSTINEKPSIR